MGEVEFIELVIQFIVPFIVGLIAYYVVPLLKEKNLYDYVKTGVYAAEQLFDSEMGQEKFTYVSNWVKKAFKISDEELQNIIEAIVFEMKTIETSKTDTVNE